MGLFPSKDGPESVVRKIPHLKMLYGFNLLAVNGNKSNVITD
jgi:hypothetical protein